MTQLPFPIKKKLVRGQSQFVLLDVPPGVTHNANVYCLDDANRIIWQLAASLISKYAQGDSPFMDINFDVDGQLVLFNWGGWKVTVNPATGEEMGYQFTK